jgi:hypothetical protein
MRKIIQSALLCQSTRFYGQSNQFWGKNGTRGVLFQLRGRVGRLVDV